MSNTVRLPVFRVKQVQLPSDSRDETYAGRDDDAF